MSGKQVRFCKMGRSFRNPYIPSFTVSIIRIMTLNARWWIAITLDQFGIIKRYVSDWLMQ